jgi:hypothetical protein
MMPSKYSPFLWAFKYEKTHRKGIVIIYITFSLVLVTRCTTGTSICTGYSAFATLTWVHRIRIWAYIDNFI